MKEIAFYLTLFVNLIIFVSIILLSIKKSKNNWSAKKAKNTITLGCLIFSIFGGLIIFGILTTIFKRLGYDMSLGHGEIIGGATLINFVIGVILAFAGRSFIAWKPIQW